MATDDALVDEFCRRWEAAGGRSYQALGGDALAEAFNRAWIDLVDVPANINPPLSVVYWVNSDLSAFDWQAALQERGVIDGVPWGDSRAMRDVSAQAVLGITGCAWAVASTGSVALYGSASTGLLPSVLPPAHLVLVRRDSVVATVADGLTRLQGQALPPLMKIVSGPSMTADIEGTLVVGVHGPGKVGAIIYSL
jgi:L-lactate utilization protein LutC